MIADRELDGLQDRFNIFDHGAEITSFHFGVEVYATCKVFAIDGIRSGTMLNVGHIRQADLSTIRGVDQQILDIGQASRVSGMPMTFTS